MLPDIRVVVTAIATTVLILVGIGLMASIRITHQGLNGGLVVASAHSDATLGSRLPWRQVPEQVVALPHETIDVTALATEEKELADRILAFRSEPTQLVSAEPSVDEGLQIAALLTREQEVPAGPAAAPIPAADPTPTASITPATKATTISPPPAKTGKKIAAVPPAAKAAAKGRPRIGATPRTGRSARATRSAADKGLLETLFGSDHTH